MPGQKISTLLSVPDLRSTDQFPMTRNGTTYKIFGDKFASKAQLDEVSLGIKSKVAAWVKFKANETVGNQTVINDFNVATVFKHYTGSFQITFANPLNIKDYCVSAICSSPTPTWVQVEGETRLEGLDIKVWGPVYTGGPIGVKDVDWITLQIVL